MELKDSKVYQEHYDSGKYQQPSVALTQDPAPEYFLAWARFIYSMWAGGACASMPTGLYGARSDQELRAYARGQQPIDKYRRIIDVQLKDGVLVEGGQTAIKAASLLNISWDNWRFFPKYRNLAISSATAQDYAPMVRATDTESARKRKLKYSKAKVVADPRMKAMLAVSGVVPDSVAEYAKMDSGDVETIMETGGFSIAEEAIMEDVAGVTMDLSDWKMVRRQMAGDYVDLGKCAAQVKLIATESRLKLEYVDAACVIAPFSTTNDHKDDAFRAVVKRTTISALRTESGLPESELWAIAKSYSSFGSNSATKARFGSSMFDPSWREEYAAAKNGQVYDHFAIDVMDFYFRANEVESVVIGVGLDGSSYQKVVPFGYDMTEEDVSLNRRLETNSIQYIWKGSWVVGTDKVFACGKDTTIVRQGDTGIKSAIIPLLYYSSDEPSMTESCISIIDDVMMAVLKTRLLISNLPPGPRLLIDMSVLDDAVQFGNRTYGVKDMLRLFGATGKLLVRTRSEFGNRDFNAANKSPITKIEASIQDDFNLFANVISTGLDMIRQVTGLNEISDGTGTPGNVLNGVAKGFQASTNNALRPISDAMETMYKNAGSCIIKKYQQLSLYGQVSISQWPVDATTLAVLKIPDGIHAFEFIFGLRLLPTDEEVAMMTQQLFQDRTNSKITESDYFIALQMLQVRDVKKAQIFLARAVAKNEERQQAAKLADIKAQADANAQSSAATEQAKQKTLGVEFQGKAGLAELEAELAENKAREDHKRAIDLLERSGAVGVMQSALEKEAAAL